MLAAVSTLQTLVNLGDDPAQVFNHLIQTCIRHDVDYLVDGMGGSIERTQCKVQLFGLFIHGVLLPEARGARFAYRRAPCCLTIVKIGDGNRLIIATNVQTCELFDTLSVS